MQKIFSDRNKTIRLTEIEEHDFQSRLLDESRLLLCEKPFTVDELENKTILGDSLTLLPFFPAEFADVLILDPPYNLTKNFNGFTFTEGSDEKYLTYLRSWIPAALKTLKKDGSVYLCGDWKNSSCLYAVLKEHNMIVRNRITWQREKGRGAKANWKNACEDIWFATVGETYYFDVEAVKQKRRVIAPYRQDGKPKDWQQTDEGAFRLTHPSNFWDDISVPYWSMSENTEHPTQKPEKLLAKLILASCPVNGLVFDPFLGSGTSSVTAKKLGRRYCGIEHNRAYACLAEKRLQSALNSIQIQGYEDGVFWERNTAHYLKNGKKNDKKVKSPK